MKETGYGVLLWENYKYEVKEQGNDTQIISIDLAYTMLTEMRVGDTWGFKLTSEKGSKMFVFEVRKFESEEKNIYGRPYICYILERKL